MIRQTALLAIAALSLLGAVALRPDAPAIAAEPGAAAGPPAGGPPPGPPPYIMRKAQPAGDRLTASGRDPQALFEHACGYCHLPGGMGTNLLVKQRIAIGEAPGTALLARRDDLTADYVEQVVRQGKGAMPAQTRVDVTDAELAAIGAWLEKGGERAN